MAEVKNSFLGARMNKDLDDRLVPDNEYRDALNISIGKSEGDNIGVAQTSLGNVELTQLNGEKFEELNGLDCIGYFSDNRNNRIYQFLTNYTDPTPSLIAPPPPTRVMKITVYDPAANPVYRTLVDGTFLNFSKTNIITGINLVEDLLFFTDNRNQPRKINVTNAFNDPGYYYTETQISVAKYAPIEPISLIRKETATVVSGTVGGADYVLSNMDSLACTIGAVGGPPLGPYTATITTIVPDGFSRFSAGDVIAGNNGTGSFGIGPVVITSLASSTSISVSSKNIFSAGTASITLRYALSAAIQPGATVLSSSAVGVKFLSGEDYAFVKSINNTTLSLYEVTNKINPTYILTFLNSTMSNQADTVGWAGDPSFIEDKFVRFSYRFKFDDNEYSLLAPFTQIAYIPKQKGYFIAGNEDNAYQSTIINWFENNSNNIELLIPFPDKCNLAPNSYKITDLEILYKESDATSAYVIDSIPSSKFISSNVSNIYSYTYQSQKPYRLLSPDQIARVYDNVPVRALAQEVSGNRVIYGNFHTTYTAPKEIDYNTSITPKQDIFDSFIEYPNHTVKQNRNYQVGFVLSDKFGRASSVILSSVDAQIAASAFNSLSIGGSTLYAPYQAEGQANFPDVREWFGNALTLLVNREISSVKNIPDGTPGLYAIPASINGFSIVSGATINILSGGLYVYQFTLDNTAGVLNTVPVVGQHLRGKFTDYAKVVNITGSGIGPYNIYTDKEINDLYLFNPAIGGLATKYSYILNEIGWYSYKIVVKQQQQDYYNVYLPGMLQGYPEGQTYGSQVIYTGVAASAVSYNGINTTSFPIGEAQKTSHIVLINDNINKVPRDLAEVGPDQKQYRSSVQLFGKVQNKSDIINLISDPTITNPLANTLTYDTTLLANYRAAEIKIGDGIQNDGSNAPVPVPLSSPVTYAPNGNRWYANTVVTSHTVVGTVGTITWSPDNITISSSASGGCALCKEFTFTRAENAQYFPTRKGDTVSSIATANDFNFITNDVNNIKGTSAINFYQLQTNPLVGRISTVNTIGVVGSKMIPFLSVYETTPDVSTLALFWETASTGYISDLNWDILTGYDGPSRLSDFVFDFWEDQDPNGVNPVTGATDSKYITDAFQILNATGLALALNSIQISNVSPNSSINLQKFNIETLLGSQYRLYITEKFVFNSGADTNSNFTFTITVNLNGVLYPLNITGRLKNRPPSFLLPNYNTTVPPVVGDVVTMTAKNGSSDISLNTQDLSWAIINGNNSGYFTIGQNTGTIRIIDPLILSGVYPLTIEVGDAMDNSTTPATPLTNITNLDLATKKATIIVYITVGALPSSSGLTSYSTGDGWVYTVPGGVSGTENCSQVPGQGWGAVYIGTQDVSLTANYVTSAGAGYVLPFPPGSDVGIGTKIIVSGTNIGAGNIVGYSNPTTYYVVGYEIDTNGVFLGWKLGITQGAAPVGITAGSLTGLSFQVFDISGGTNPNLPLPNQFFQYTVNVEIENGKSFNSAYAPTGLLQGELEFTVNNFVYGFFGQARSSSTTWWMYHRQDPSYPWALIRDTNGVYGAGDVLYCSAKPTNNQMQVREKKFVQNTPGEYCLVIKNECAFQISGDGGPDSESDCNDGFEGGAGVEVRDANFAYGGNGINPGPKLPPMAQKYYLAGQEYSSSPAVPGYPTGTPLLTQNAVEGFGTVVQASPIAVNPVNQNKLFLTASDVQLVKGMKYMPSTINFGPTITASSAGNNIITLWGDGATTEKLVIGMSIEVNSDSGGFGMFAPGTIITGITNSLVFTVNLLPTSVLGGRTFTVSNAWFTPATDAMITDFENAGTTLVLSSDPVIAGGGILPAGAKIPFGFPAAADVDQSNFNRGIVYANEYNSASPNMFSSYQTNPINVKQFFLDTALSIPWIPPVAGKAYNFMSSVPFSFVTGTPTQTSMHAITNYPYFSAFFDAYGKVISQPLPGNTIVTLLGEYLPGSTASAPISYDPVNRPRNLYQNINI